MTFCFEFDLGLWLAGLQLLEGLQSSLIISKIPSVSHNRNTKGEYLFDSSLIG